MRKMLVMAAAACLVVSLSCSASRQAQASGSLPDTEDNRVAQARRYLEVMPPRDLFRDMAKNLAPTMPATEAAHLEKLLTERLDMETLEAFMLESLTKHFTADELRVLTDFYGSPVGGSAMHKFGEYMADVMPFIQTQAMKALEQAQERGR